MKKLSVVMLAMLLFVGVSFAARGDSSYSTSSSSGSKAKSSSSSRFGLGYSKMEVNAAGNVVNLDSIAGRFWFSDNLGIDASIGFRSGDSPSTFLGRAKLIGNFIKINKLNIYWLAGVAFGSYDPKDGVTGSISLFGLQGGVGAEFFVLPCLSVLTEMGLEYRSASVGGTSFSDSGVFADWLPQAGIRFYFN